MTMRLTAFLGLLASATAAPALVWQSERGVGDVAHSADEISAESLLSGLQKPAVVFLLGRSESGAESLTQMASQLPSVAAKPASTVHHHVTGVQNAGYLNANMPKSVIVSLDELAETKSVEIDGTGKMQKRVRDADVLIVEVDASTEPSVVDKAVVNAIDDYDNVVFTAVRSVAEVKHEREMASRRRLQMQHEAGNRMQQRRRLEDEAQEEEENAEEQQQDNNNDQDLSGVYYVHLTPNILAGVLFFLLFSTITWIGISCMGMIQGQDMYVSKYPTIGREA